MHCNVYPIFVKFVRLTHSNKELLTYLLTYLHIGEMASIPSIHAFNFRAFPVGQVEPRIVVAFAVAVRFACRIAAQIIH